MEAPSGARVRRWAGIVALLLVLGMVPGPRPVDAAGSSIHLSRATAARGDAVGVSGAGFTPADLVAVFVTFQISGGTRRVATTTTVTATGTFDTAVTVPSGAFAGAYTVTARDAHARVATATLTILPVVSLRPGTTSHGGTVVANSPFFLRGTGFQPDERVTVRATFPLYNNTAVVVGRTVTADRAGALTEIVLTVPLDARPGEVTVSARGASSRRVANGTVDVTYRPALTPAERAVRPGTSLIIAGRGFVPGSRVHFALAVPVNGTTTQLGGDANTDSFGALQVSIPIPAGAATGTYTVRATDLTGGFTATTSIAIVLRAVITVQPALVTAGGRVTVTGAGFRANDAVQISAVVTLTGGGQQEIVQQLNASNRGGFTTILALPADAAAGAITITARTSHTTASARVTVVRLAASLLVSPPAAIPGSTVRVTGKGFPAGAAVNVTGAFKLTSGTNSTVTVPTRAGADGNLSAYLRVPANAVAGKYLVEARAGSRSLASTTLTVVVLAPAIVALPTTAAPGTRITVHGAGFPVAVTVTLVLGGTTLTPSPITSTSGTFSATVTVPAGAATGSTVLSASTASGTRATATISVVRSVSTHLYVSSLYTGRGYHEYITLINPTETSARVTITYDRKDGTTTARGLTVAAHSRATEDVNADLGSRVSAAAVVSADVPINAERFVYHGSDGDVVPAESSPSSTWYFANGNTGGGYREYIAIQNPNHRRTQVALHFLPAHHAPFTIFRTLNPTSRVTVKVNTFVAHDAVGVTVLANAPVVANRTVFIHHGMTSTDGVRVPQRTWYIAGGPSRANARVFIGLINPSAHRVYVTLHAYGPFGGEIGTTARFIRGYGRVGFLLNRLAHSTDAAVLVAANGGVIAEQMTYVGALHDASTDVFGSPVPSRTWTFSAVNTSTTQGENDALVVFNPNLTEIPVVVDFISASGAARELTYTLGPLYHQTVNIGTVVPNGQLGLVVASSAPIVALNRGTFNFGSGAFADRGSP